MTVPIHREGWPFIALFAAVNLLAFLFSAWLGAILLPLTVWCVAFFRDPERKTPERPGLIICPADGVLLPLMEAVAAGGTGPGRNAAAPAFGLHERLQCACEPQSHIGHDRRQILSSGQVF